MGYTDFSNVLLLVLFNLNEVWMILYLILPIFKTKWLKLCSLILCKAFFNSKANSTKRDRWAQRTSVGSSG